MKRICISISTLLATMVVSPVVADEVRLAVAANFSKPMQAISKQFEQTTGHRLKISYGSSGKFAAQIQQGAPFDVFFSADQHKPEVLIQKGFAVPDNQRTYAVGALALWSSSQSSTENDVFKRLQSGDFNKLAIANPRLAPYGLAAIQVLESLQLAEVTEPKRVQGENIAQTYQFVSSGNADLGFVALAQVIEADRIQKTSVWIVPSDLHQAIRQDVVLLKRGQQNQAAKALLAFIQSPQGKAIIESYGYKTLPIGLDSQ